MDITEAKERDLERLSGKHVSYWRLVRLMMMDLWSWLHLLHPRPAIVILWVQPPP